jgi:putative glutamine amidotransferase
LEKSMKPIIAITTNGESERDLSNAYYEKFYYLPKLYVDAVRRAGGVPVLVPHHEDAWDSVLAMADGVLVTGGADVNPAEYGGNVEHPNLTGIDRERDKSELVLMEKLINGKPIPTLAICRGMQVMNIALGGSLTEHVADIHPEDIHRGDDGGWTLQAVQVDPASRLAEIMEADKVATTSGHHQAVKVLGKNLKVTARAADGIIEALEHTELPWMMGVQWHPEVTAAEDPTQQRLFDELVAEAIRRKSN